MVRKRQMSKQGPVKRSRRNGRRKRRNKVHKVHKVCKVHKVKVNLPEVKEKPKTRTIFQIAKEVNRQSTEILDYLKRIGFEAGGLMSKVDEGIYRKILGHFKSDIEEAEKHKQKLIEFQKRHKDVELTEIRDEVKKEAERKQREEEERLRRLETEMKLKQEREMQLQKELEEKRKQLKQKEEELEKAKLKPGVKLVKPAAEKRVEEKELSEKKPEVPKPETKLKPKFKERERKVFSAERGKPPRQAEFRKRKEEAEAKLKPGEKRDEHRKFERVMIKEDFFRKPMPGRGKGQKPFQRRPPGARPTDRPEKKAGAATGAAAEERRREIGKKAGTVREKPKKARAGVEVSEAKRRRDRKFDEELATQEIEEAIRDTMAKIDDGGMLSIRSQIRKRKKKERIEEERKHLEEIARTQNILRVTEFISAGELAGLMGIPVNELIQKSFNLGMMITINQRLDRDLIVLLADEFGYRVEFQKEYEVDLLADTEDPVEDLKPRPPVVTIMGHVDHGKTSLLDYIRKTNVVAGEAGGITQHIGAYQVSLDGRAKKGKLISFLDTPGHEAFTAMRARGAQITDIVVLVVAADDNVMPQTVEAINHSLAANVPIVIAINKIDKPNADSQKIKTQLAEKGILVEEWGGKYQSVEISAKTGKDVDLLLEKILLEAELLDLKAKPNRKARGVIVEAQLDRGRGIVGTVLVQKGTLRIGDPFVAGIYSGKVKAMFDERGRRVESVKPATPVQVLGFDGMPQAGDIFAVLGSERDTKDIALKRQQLKREQDFRTVRFITLDDISKRIKEGKQADLNVIIKGDVDGSVEALSDSLQKLETPEVKVKVIHKGIGEISENDVLLAAASGAIIIGFNVRPNLKARKLSQSEKVDIRQHNVIYDVINEIKLALEGLLEPEKSEEVLATVEVRQTFKIPRIGMIAGCYVLDGKLSRGNRVRLLRDGFEIFNGSILSLKRFKDDVREVEAGYECGLGLENYNDIKVGDVIESYRIVETKRKLS
jgi:translation initiation factor IF-2